MIQRKLNLLISVFLLGGVYFLMLFLLTSGPLLAENAFAIISVWLTGIFITCGLIAGVTGVVIAGITAESLIALPTGTIIIASACAGLAMMHLSKVQSLSFPWRGAGMAAAGAIVWSGLVALMHSLQPGESLSGIETARIVAWQGLIATTIWLTLLVLYLGTGSLFKQPRPTNMH